MGAAQIAPGLQGQHRRPSDTSPSRLVLWWQWSGPGGKLGSRLLPREQTMKGGEAARESLWKVRKASPEPPASSSSSPLGQKWVTSPPEPTVKVFPQSAPPRRSAPDTWGRDPRG